MSLDLPWKRSIELKKIVICILQAVRESGWWPSTSWTPRASPLLFRRHSWQREQKGDHCAGGDGDEDDADDDEDKNLEQRTSHS